MNGTPLFVDCARLRVLMVGGGAVATRKAKQFATAISDELSRLALEFAIPIEERPYESSDIGDAQLIFAATNDRAVNEQVARDADAANRLVNVTDDAQGGTFSVMAAHHRGSLTVAVNAGGAPTAALRIRDAIAERFDARYGDALADLVALRRQLLAAGKADQWHKCAAAIIDDEFCDTVEQGQLAQKLAPWR